MTTISLPEATVEPRDVHDVLRRHLLVDGFDLVLDLEASSGSRLVDARDGTAYLDLFTFFASSALGMNHPALLNSTVPSACSTKSTTCVPCVYQPMKIRFWPGTCWNT